MIISTWLKTAASVLSAPWRDDSGEGGGLASVLDDESSGLRLTSHGIAVGEVSNSDSGIGLEGYVEQDSRNLLDRAVRGLEVNGNLAGSIYGFMRDNVFGADELNYSNISSTIDYLDTLSRRADGDGSRAADTAKTVLSHLDDYISEGGNTVNGFKKHLFGVGGVLTQKRLRDMKKATSYVTNNHQKLDERKEYGMSVGDSIDRLDASYTIDRDGRVLVNVNHNNSLGMNTGNGRVYWSSFNQMFSEDVNIKSAVTRYVKKSIQADHEQGNADMFSRKDWKLNALRNYAKYLK